MLSMITYFNIIHTLHSIIIYVIIINYKIIIISLIYNTKLVQCALVLPLYCINIPNIFYIYIFMYFIYVHICYPILIIPLSTLMLYNIDLFERSKYNYLFCYCLIPLTYTSSEVILPSTSNSSHRPCLSSSTKSPSNLSAC